MRRCKRPSTPAMFRRLWLPWEGCSGKAKCQVLKPLLRRLVDQSAELSDIPLRPATSCQQSQRQHIQHHQRSLISSISSWRAHRGEFEWSIDPSDGSRRSCFVAAELLRLSVSRNIVQFLISLAKRPNIPSDDDVEQLQTGARQHRRVLMEGGTYAAPISCIRYLLLPEILKP